MSSLVLTCTCAGQPVATSHPEPGTIATLAIAWTMMHHTDACHPACHVERSAYAPVEDEEWIARCRRVLKHGILSEVVR